MSPMLTGWPPSRRRSTIARRPAAWRWSKSRRRATATSWSVSSNSAEDITFLPGPMSASMLVVMTFVPSVAVSVVHVVDVIAVGHGLMTASLAVHVGMAGVGDVFQRPLVVVVVVGTVRVTVVNVVRVIAVVDGGVAAAGPVLMGVVPVDRVLAHDPITSLLRDCVV